MSAGFEGGLIFLAGVLIFYEAGRRLLLGGELANITMGLGVVGAATAVNLSGQLRNVLLREITEADAIYYIGEVEVADAETLIYTINVMPAESTTPLSLRYQRQYFVDG